MLVCVCVCVCVSASRVDVVHLALATCKPSTEISLFSLDGLQNREGRGGENVVGGLLGEVLKRCTCMCVCVVENIWTERFQNCTLTAPS